ncbi:hypothetical protein [Caulifigura coniformis]|uniref:hypothetical protein n=1 Tax=Caulifigura coniformis TaxID=2527983 RepID=UPI001E5BB58B|nr:hypothetical protein [Caulifigura coniformis]
MSQFSSQLVKACHESITSEYRKSVSQAMRHPARIDKAMISAKRRRDFALQVLLLAGSPQTSHWHDYDALVALAKSAESVRQHKDTSRLAQLAISIDPSRPDAYEIFGISLLNTHKHEHLSELLNEIDKQFDTLNTSRSLYVLAFRQAIHHKRFDSALAFSDKAAEHVFAAAETSDAAVRVAVHFFREWVPFCAVHEANWDAEHSMARHASQLKRGFQRQHAQITKSKNVDEALDTFFKCIRIHILLRNVVRLSRPESLPTEYSNVLATYGDALMRQVDAAIIAEGLKAELRVMKEDSCFWENSEEIVAACQTLSTKARSLNSQSDGVEKVITATSRIEEFLRLHRTLHRCIGRPMPSLNNVKWSRRACEWGPVRGRIQPSVVALIPASRVSHLDLKALRTLLQRWSVDGNTDLAIIVVGSDLIQNGQLAEASSRILFAENDTRWSVGEGNASEWMDELGFEQAYADAMLLIGDRDGNMRTGAIGIGEQAVFHAECVLREIRASEEDADFFLSPVLPGFRRDRDREVDGEPVYRAIGR